MSLAADELILGWGWRMEDVCRRGQTGGEGASTRLPRELRGHSWEHRECRVRDGLFGHTITVELINNQTNINYLGFNIHSSRYIYHLE